MSIDSGGRVLVGGIIQQVPFIYRAFLYDVGLWKELPPSSGYEQWYNIFDKCVEALCADNIIDCD
jgi:hypothetical protein